MSASISHMLAAIRSLRWFFLLVFLVLTGIVWAAEPSRPTNLMVPPLPEPKSGPVATEVVVRVVAHGAMVLGDEVGGARVTITDTASGKVLASGLQTGEPGDQNQIMRTPRLMEEPRYSTKPSASFRTTLHLNRPTPVKISAQGPLGYPSAMQRASKTVLLIPGLDMSQDGIVLELNGFIVQIENPPPGESLIAKDDVKLQASIRMLSGAPVRPHGDWDSRKVIIYGEVLVGDRIVERLQMFYSGTKSSFEGQFFVPVPTDAPHGILLRVVVADGAGGNFGMGQAKHSILSERLKPPRKDGSR
ncbi:MAG TPA: hypothetical protein VGQ60_04480 [Nitrospiraceae bacterium]|jgi:hypothetical protein|nr:hypothetical protein [Nitrospiraceae bacterium]